MIKFLTEPKNTLRLTIVFIILWLGLGFIESREVNQNELSAYKITPITIVKLQDSLLSSSYDTLKIISREGKSFRNELDFKSFLKNKLPLDEYQKYGDFLAKNSKYRISWLRDIMGHWLVIFIFALAITITIADKILSKKLKNEVSSEDILKSRKREIVISILIAFMICFTLGFFNFRYVAGGANFVEHWQNAISKPEIAFITAFGFYLICLFPFFCSTIMYVEKIYYFSNYPESFKNYDYKNHDLNFGLSSIGNSLVWYIIFALVGCLPLAYFQHLKQDLTVAFFVAPILLGIAIYLMAVRPLWRLYDVLKTQKEELYQEKSARRNKLEISIERANSQEKKESFKTDLELLKEDLLHISKLSCMPMSFPNKIIGFIGAVATIVAAVLSILEAFK